MWAGPVSALEFCSPEFLDFSIYGFWGLCVKKLFQMTERLSALFFLFFGVAKLVQVIAVDLMISQHLCSKNFNFFLKMKTMWAEAVLAPGLWIAGFLNFSISVGAKPFLLDKCLLKSLTKFCFQISVSHSTE